MTESAGERLLAYLREHNTATIATVGPDGPWAAAVFYVNEDLDLWWLSKPGARHSINLARDPRAAVTIQEDYGSRAAVQGVQMEGVVTEVRLPALAAGAMRLYVAKHAAAGELSRSPLEIATALTSTRAYHFEPTRAYFIDNTRGSGRREEVEVPARLAAAGAR
jgi:uncharacterized protein YhbP (UPF0306 family)